MPEFIYIMDLIGTIAFAISGAMLAVKKDMDLFGIMILALTTATGGGFIRDLTIGNIPPAVFLNPVYIILSFATALVVFFVIRYVRKGDRLLGLIRVYEKLLLVTDSLGLAAFTVDGVYAGRTVTKTNAFLMIFLGVITGVGGGILRDLFAAQKPYIFVRHVYALASVAGAVVTAVLPAWIGWPKSIVLGFVTVLLIRYLAAHFRWNLPRALPDGEL